MRTDVPRKHTTVLSSSNCCSSDLSTDLVARCTGRGAGQERQLKDIRSERLARGRPLQAAAIGAPVPSSTIAIIALLGVRDDAIATRRAETIDTERIAAALIVRRAGRILDAGTREAVFPRHAVDILSTQLANVACAETRCTLRTIFADLTNRQLAAIRAAIRIHKVRIVTRLRWRDDAIAAGGATAIHTNMIRSALQIRRAVDAGLIQTQLRRTDRTVCTRFTDGELADRRAAIGLILVRIVTRFGRRRDAVPAARTGSHDAELSCGTLIVGRA